MVVDRGPGSPTLVDMKSSFDIQATRTQDPGPSHRITDDDDDNDDATMEGDAVYTDLSDRQWSPVKFSIYYYFQLLHLLLVAKLLLLLLILLLSFFST